MRQPSGPASRTRHEQPSPTMDSVPGRPSPRRVTAHGCYGQGRGARNADYELLLHDAVRCYGKCRTGCPVRPERMRSGSGLTAFAVSRSGHDQMRSAPGTGEDHAGRATEHDAGRLNDAGRDHRSRRLLQPPASHRGSCAHDREVAWHEFGELPGAIVSYPGRQPYRHRGPRGSCCSTCGGRRPCGCPGAGPGSGTGGTGPRSLARATV